jgi:IS30 family transposase
MPSAKRLTYEERKEIEGLYNSGVTCKQIADTLGRHPKYIRVVVKKALDSGGKFSADFSQSMVRNSGPVKRRLSVAQVETINDGISRGLTLRQIANLTRTSDKKVLEYLETMGLEVSKGTSYAVANFNNRLSALEQSVKILTESMREIMKRLK